jgi:TonB family protein
MPLIRSQEIWFLCISAALSSALSVVGPFQRSPEQTLIGSSVDLGNQNSSDELEQAVRALVRSLEDPLKQAKAKKIVVLDLRDLSGHLHPVGKWIADQLSSAVHSEFPKLQTIDRSRLMPTDEIPGTAMDDDAIFRREVDEARAVGADVMIDGYFASTSSQIGISLTIVRLSELWKTHDIRSGPIPIVKELIDLSPGPIPSLVVDGVTPRAGRGGISMPVCVRCPFPPRTAMQRGVVNLELVVTTDGRPESIRVIKSPNAELTAAAIQTVQSWRFKPAAGLDGRPIAVVTPIQLEFR